MAVAVLLNFIYFEKRIRESDGVDRLMRRVKEVIEWEGERERLMKLFNPSLASSSEKQR
jgi:hypothetical protein